MIDRFVGELQIMLTDLYKTNITFSKIELPPTTGNRYSTVILK